MRSHQHVFFDRKIERKNPLILRPNFYLGVKCMRWKFKSFTNFFVGNFFLFVFFSLVYWVIRTEQTFSCQAMAINSARKENDFIMHRYTLEYIHFATLLLKKSLSQNWTAWALEWVHFQIDYLHNVDLIVGAVKSQLKSIWLK